MLTNFYFELKIGFKKSTGFLYFFANSKTMSMNLINILLIYKNVCSFRKTSCISKNVCELKTKSSNIKNYVRLFLNWSPIQKKIFKPVRNIKNVHDF